MFFDLDGTLWDALEALTLSWNETMIRNNKKYRFSKEKMQSFMGLTPEETYFLAFPDLSFDEAKELFNTCIKDQIKFLRNTPGKTYENEDEILELLSKKYPLFVVSNSEKGYVETYLEACKKEKYFLDHVCAGDTGLAKWQNILYLKEKYNIETVVYVGDTQKDFDESSRAGVKFIHANYGFGKINHKCLEMNELKELPILLEQIKNM